MSLQNEQGQTLTVQSVRPVEESATTYNLPIANDHTYFAEDLKSIASKKGYEASKVDQTKVLYNKNGSPKYLVRSNTSHSGEVFKGFNNENSAIAAARSGTSRTNQRVGSYDIHLNRVED